MPGEYPTVDLICDPLLADYAQGALRMIPALQARYGHDAIFVYHQAWHRVYRGRPPLVEHRYTPASEVERLPADAVVVALTNHWCELHLSDSLTTIWLRREEFRRTVLCVDDPEFRIRFDSRPLLEYLVYHEPYERVFQRELAVGLPMLGQAKLHTRNLYLAEVTAFLRAVGTPVDGSLYGLIAAMREQPAHPFWHYFDMCFSDWQDHPTHDELLMFWRPWVEDDMLPRHAPGRLPDIADLTRTLLTQHARWLFVDLRRREVAEDVLLAAREYSAQHPSGPDLGRNLAWLLS